ncbi:50S ribosomal protein L4 [Candidatus Peregrinibacteria bacterium]|nr:MAG: 50S ribosomal protein L4 [Candidatus Peregrinibacteria bacterium]
MKIDLYSSTGEKKEQIPFPKGLLIETPNFALMHEALIRQEANARFALACTKTRSFVRGGGAKPWRQKGTGRARQGSRRSPQWRGGAVLFGPTGDQNFVKQMPKKMRRKALLSAISAKVSGKEVFAIETFQVEIPKTKHFAELLSHMKCSGKTLVVTSGRDEILEKSARNIPNVKVLFAQYLNIKDIVDAKQVIFLQEALQVAENIFGNQ